MLNRILAGPLPGRRLVLGAIVLVDVSDLRNKRIVRVRVREHRADGQEDWSPLESVLS